MADYNYGLSSVPSIVLHQPSATYKVVSTPSLFVDGSTPAVGTVLGKTDGKVGGVVVAQGVYGYIKQYPAYNLTYYITFPEEITRLNSINVYYCAASNYNDDHGVNYANVCTKKIYVKQAGIYNLKSSVVGMPGVGPSKIQLWTITFDPAEQAVQGIAINAYQPYGSRSSFYLGFYISEIQAMGVIYEDIGIRHYDGFAVRGIGVNKYLDSDHKLRIFDGSNVRGIDTISIDRDDANKIRIYDGLVIKSLPEIGF